MPASKYLIFSHFKTATYNSSYLLRGKGPHLYEPQQHQEVIMDPHQITRTILKQLLAPLSEESALSALLVLDKLVHIASSSVGFNMQLILYIKKRSDGERYYGKTIDVMVYGRDPLRRWYRGNHTYGSGGVGVIH